MEGKNSDLRFNALLILNYLLLGFDARICGRLSVLYRTGRLNQGAKRIGKL